MLHIVAFFLCTLNEMASTFEFKVN